MTSFPFFLPENITRITRNTPQRKKASKIKGMDFPKRETKRSNTFLPDSECNGERKGDKLVGFKANYGGLLLQFQLLEHRSIGGRRLDVIRSFFGQKKWFHWFCVMDLD